MQEDLTITPVLRSLAALAERGGVRVVISDLLPTTKTITWRNERKWAHRKMHQRNRAYRLCSTQVPCNDCIFAGGTVYVTPAVWEQLQKLPVKSGLLSNW
ncbi:hypothetical protein [Stutzerimonas nitrititolerans]|uniref:hypothetical protein n=1 Tax=Stutzerimonas nitrititolerans TaxID=2482751 RepID=UPI0028A7BB25|nr:hypothetical protein [Stutzerimonas nitrititolerans]